MCAPWQDAFFNCLLEEKRSGASPVTRGRRARLANRRALIAACRCNNCSRYCCSCFQMKHLVPALEVFEGPELLAFLLTSFLSESGMSIQPLRRVQFLAVAATAHAAAAAASERNVRYWYLKFLKVQNCLHRSHLLSLESQPVIPVCKVPSRAPIRHTSAQHDIFAARCKQKV